MTYFISKVITCSALMAGLLFRVTAAETAQSIVYSSVDLNGMDLNWCQPGTANAKILLLDDGLGWGEAPRFEIDAINRSRNSVKNITGSITITDVLTQKSVLQETLALDEIPSERLEKITVTPQVANGVYDVTWRLSDDQAVLPETSSSVRIARMAGEVGGPAFGPFEKRYMTNWGLIGGIFWETPLAIARKTGATWERLGNRSCWNQLETAPGSLDLALLQKSVQEDDAAGLSFIYFNTLYNQPPFYSIADEQFAPKYGFLHASEATVVGNLVTGWELGNEDNGTAKFFWSEIARSGAAGVRSHSSTAILCTTGVASIDMDFFHMQQNRGLFDRLDALCTHPYTWGASPETYDMEGKLGAVDQLIDTVGGMKLQLTTEWGYSEKFDQLKRAQWVPRNYAIAAAAGLYRHGLYSFDNQFGLYSYGGIIPYPAAATLNAYAWLTYGYHFAGWFQQSPEVWAACFEKGGKSLLMAWSPTGENQVHIPLLEKTKAPVIRDMFGNIIVGSIPEPKSSGFDIVTSESPIYISNLPDEVLLDSYKHELAKAKDRFQRCLSVSTLKDNPAWNSLTEADKIDAAAIQKPLLDWQPADGSISLNEQAVIAQALRWLVLETHFEASANSGTVSRSYSIVDTRPKWISRLETSVKNDVDLPSLRWLLNMWNESRDELMMVNELGNGPYAIKLASLEQVYDHLAAQLADHGPQVFFPIWPYLHAPSATGLLSERFVFVPGECIPVNVRLQSYSSHAYDGEVSLELPPGWTSNPNFWKGRIEALTSQELCFSVVAAEGDAKTITAILKVTGKPIVRIPFDDFNVLPPLKIKAPVLAGLMPRTPLDLRLENRGSHASGVMIRILKQIDGPALARVRVDSIEPGETKLVTLPLPSTSQPMDFNEWNLMADLNTTDGKNFQVPLSIDFGISTRVKSPILIDGNLQDWKEAAPLHIYPQRTQNSPASPWDNEKALSVVFTQWNDQNFYIAVDVHEPTAQQNLYKDSRVHDSIQFCLVGPDQKVHDFTLTQVGQEPQILDDLGKVRVGQLRTTVSPGEQVYEGAIPWWNISPVKPAPGMNFLFDVMINDHDADGNRRTREPYGTEMRGAIDPSKFGHLALVDETPVSFENVASNGAKVVFYENFDEYAPDSLPDTWTVAGSATEGLHSVVRSNIGVNGSSCLELFHPGDKIPNVFLSLTRPLRALVVGKKYRLSFQTKGILENSDVAVGTCLDTFGNIGYNWPAPCTTTDDWHEYTLDWTAAGGDLRIIIRNEGVKTKSLLIDEVKVTEMP